MNTNTETKNSRIIDVIENARIINYRTLKQYCYANKLKSIVSADSDGNYDEKAEIVEIEKIEKNQIVFKCDDQECRQAIGSSTIFAYQMRSDNSWVRVDDVPVAKARLRDKVSVKFTIKLNDDELKALQSVYNEVENKEETSFVDYVKETLSLRASRLIHESFENKEETSEDAK